MIGVVLAGGEGRRFGEPKAFVRVGGERLVDRAARTLHEAGLAVMVAGGRFGDCGTGLPALPDAQEGSGPLGAVVAALQRDDAVVLACDLPTVDAAFVHRLIEARGPFFVALPVAASREQPLAACYGKGALTQARAVLAGDRSMRALVRQLPSCYIKAEESWLRNVNTAQDLVSLGGAGR